METKTAQNGKAKTGSSPASNGKIQPAKQGEPKPQTLTDTETPFQPEGPSILTVEEKIKKVNSLNDLIGCRNILRNHLERVEGLKFGDYDEKDTITLTSAAGGTYVIKSSALCQKIKVLLTEQISGKIEEVEEQINF